MPIAGYIFIVIIVAVVGIVLWSRTDKGNKWLL